MSACFNQVRRSVCTIASSKHVLSSLTNNFVAPSQVAATTVASSTPVIAQRQFSAAKKPKGNETSSVITYQARKDAAKQKRRDTWASKHQRLDALKTRRDGKDVGARKREFRGWWDKEMMYHDILTQKAKQEGKAWRIRVATMVERLPVVTPDVEEWEREYNDLRDYLMTFGKEFPPETGFMPPASEDDHVVMSDEEMLAMLPFTPAPRETEADATGDVKSLDRELKTRVFLTIRSDNEGNKSGPRWTLPSTIPTNDETLLAAAQRAVSDSVGSDLVLWPPSNAPMGVNFRVYNKNLPEDFRQDYYGEKIFYYRVQWDNGDVSEEGLKNGGVEDYAWLTKEEMVGKVIEERGPHQAKFFHYML